MTEVKFTQLPAGAAPFDNGSLFAIAVFDGASTYISEKLTATQVRELMLLLEAEQKITFDSSGTNKSVVVDSNSNAQIDFLGATNHQVSITTDSGGFSGAYIDLSQGSLAAAIYAWFGVNSPTGQFDDPGNGGAVIADEDCVRIGAGDTVRVAVDKTGVGFNASTPIAKPVITGSRGGNVALANFLTAFDTYGLIIDNTTP